MDVPGLGHHRYPVPFPPAVSLQVSSQPAAGHAEEVHSMHRGRVHRKRARATRDGLARFTRAGGLALACASASLSGHARAQSTDATPALGLTIAHRQTTEELEALTRRLPPEVRRRLVGVYVAFDPSVTDVGSMAACDDDGDYVVVVSDALLRLADFVAQAEATDEIFWTHKLDEYAALLAESQRSGTRSLPPPPGFFGATRVRSARELDVESSRFREIVAGVLAHELAHLIQSDLVCPNPTATHERGDDEWTREEREHALTVAQKLYTPARVLAADGAGIDRLLDSGKTEQGELAWLFTLDRIERASRERADPAALSTYLRLHEACGVRMEVARAAANRWRELHALSPPMSVNR